MTPGRFTEISAGVLIALWGLLLLTLAYLQPYGDSRYPEPISLHPGFTPIETPYLLGFGLLLTITVGSAILDGVRPSIILVMVLCLAVAALCVLTGLAMASIGLGLLPASAIGCVALIAALVRRIPRPGCAG